MLEPTLSIPYFPQIYSRLITASLVFFLLLFGGFLFTISNETRWNSFFILWFSFIGLIAFLTLFTWRTRVFSKTTNIIKTYYLLGFIPLWSENFQISEFTHIKRRVTCARGYDTEGMYHPEIYLAGKGQREIKLQEFVDCNDNHHTLSEEWAKKISTATRLPVIDFIESWNTNQA
ncbi:hypothetical protein [Sulfurirhabdus autotrophica]|uniref:Uncharacterized protein n=1 Tax=Sulfurirhabdus autotrophica TaxID=1706046 RepID=A0A4R3XXK6_9PROT|nr:hypothetical protein [Sulfurirhabdus autotrophica]TCV84066.1 hypothetical protein EDC63_1131 [Sulfurirhabdus autotrophica]